jgi:hypothetical protein
MTCWIEDELKASNKKIKKQKNHAHVITYVSITFSELIMKRSRLESTTTPGVHHKIDTDKYFLFKDIYNLVVS